MLKRKHDEEVTRITDEYRTVRCGQTVFCLVQFSKRSFLTATTCSHIVYQYSIYNPHETILKKNELWAICHYCEHMDACVTSDCGGKVCFCVCYAVSELQRSGVIIVSDNLGGSSFLRTCKSTAEMLCSFWMAYTRAPWYSYWKFGTHWLNTEIKATSSNNMSMRRQLESKPAPGMTSVTHQVDESVAKNVAANY